MNLGRVLARLEQPTDAEDGPESGFERICAMLTKAASQVSQPLKGIGIGCTGPVDPFTGTLRAHRVHALLGRAQVD